MCALSRLARYNATVAALEKTSSGKIKYFEGTPVPTSLLLVLLIFIEVHYERIGTGWLWWHVVGELKVGMLLYVLLGVAMTSKTLRIPKL
jgi:CDP-diacylglycerol--serine O-phosphatidyltransferase